ncbi:trypsin-like serine protease [Streptomyces sp. XD-27]|uniref:S1 family peptidase n=1 Tax=Streptomyces sp. XD-27 TaxID=3062779 RepID=UPI0026F41C1E|nr:serine protease [Streptomyces sp. XD-27]WKX70991.1 serine protease [Streptomyces sp. XD-27]
MRLSLHSRRAQRISVGTAAVGAALALVGTAASTAFAAGSTPAKPDGQRIIKPIIGGTETPKDKYPFMAALLSKGKGSALDRQFCGGSLINPNVIMTAAHCVDGETPEGMQVAVGRTVLSDSKQGQVRNVFDITVHPRYAKDPAYDMAFLMLDKPVKGIAPIKLPTQGTDALIRPGAKATVTGWGNTDTDMPNFPDRLREVKVPLVSHDECKISYNEYDAKVNICAGVEGKDSCQGDSGGPLFRTVPGRATPYQIGIVSYGEGCAAQGAPGVYTSVSSDKLWKTLSESEQGKKIKRLLGRR